MLWYALLVEIKSKFINNKLDRKSIDTISTSTRLNRRSIAQEITPTREIFRLIMCYLSISDCVRLIAVCQAWSGPAAAAFYLTPPFTNKLYYLLSQKNTFHPYNLLIREFIFAGII
jgi:hypothetical protein